MAFEPCSALDPISTLKSKNDAELKKTFSIRERDPQHAAGRCGCLDQTALFNAEAVEGYGKVDYLGRVLTTERSSITAPTKPPRTTSPAASAELRRCLGMFILWPQSYWPHLMATNYGATNPLAQFQASLPSTVGTSCFFREPRKAA